MADPLRNPVENSTLEEPIVPDQGVDHLLAGIPSAGNLPRPENARLNRTAESIGTALGSTVVKMRSGLSLVQSREREIARDLSQRISQQTETLSAAVVERAEQFGDVAEEKASQLYDVAQQRWNDLNQAARNAVLDARKKATQLRDEHPLELIAAFAAAGFVLGAALKVWRSNHD